MAVVFTAALQVLWGGSRPAVSGMRLLDPSGKPLVLYGINVINKSREQGYTEGIGPADFAAIRRWGMNSVRLGIFWDGLEPEPGRFDQQYLDRIARIVGWAKAEGLYVMLDMHQDLYSVKFGDGAPAWATLDEGRPHATGVVWSDAYYRSEAVQTALDHFWANSPAPDGVGLQDHYARVWRRVAARFRDEPAVLGYDLMNEPFPGRDATRVEQATLRRLAELLRARLGRQAAAPEELVATATTLEGRKRILEWLNDMDLFRGTLEAAAAIMQEFERGRLMPFYARVRNAIREVDSRGILFLEPAMSANVGVLSAIIALADQSGRRDPAQVYAPHGYDLVDGTPLAALRSRQRIELIFRRHAQTAKRLRMPMVIGEWGAHELNPAAAEQIRFTRGLFDSLACGAMYWAYRRELSQSPLALALSRPAFVRKATPRVPSHDP